MIMKEFTFLHYNPKLKKYARQLRNNSTKSERELWKYLKGRNMKGHDFHRQKPIDEYIVDFFCPKLMLAIELDGYRHLLEEYQKKDRRKEYQLMQLGVKTIRFWDDEVLDDIDNVLRVIEEIIKEREKELEL
ncbi:MAG: endonuclease domain-containing protein [Fidelibacterota bacterium]